MFVLSILIILSVIVRIIFFNFISYDYGFAIDPWINLIKNNGYFFALGQEFGTYTPPYLYILVFLSYLPVLPLYSVKIVSIIFEFVIAVFVMLIVGEKYKNKAIQWFSFFAVLFAPTLIMNGALWGQCDSIYSAGVIAMIYFIFKKKWGHSLFCFSVALTFKLQTAFMFPLLAIFFLREKKIRKHFLQIPIIFLISILPNYFFGRPLKDLILIYWNLQINDQYNTENLTMNAPNIYHWISTDSPNFFFYIGFLFTLILVCCIIIYVNKNIKNLSNETLIKISFLLSLVVPYFLPRMHERYFFLADILSIIFAFYFPRFFYVPIVVIGVSAASYLPFLFGTQINFQLLALSLLIVTILVATDFIKQARSSRAG